MRNSIKNALIIAGVCLLLGWVLITVSLARNGLDVRKFSTLQQETNTYTPTEPFTGIYIDDTASDIYLKPSADSTVQIVCVEDEACRHTVSVQAGTLRIIAEDTRPWYAHIGFFVYRQPSVTVYLPLQDYQTLYVKTLSGDIDLPDCFRFSDVKLQTTSGDLTASTEAEGAVSLKSTSGTVRLDRIVCASLTVKTTSGDIFLQKVNTSNFVSVDSTSGDVDLKNAVIGSEVSCTTTSGELSFHELVAKTLFLKSTSGDMELNDVQISGPAKLQAVSGDIELNSADAASFWIKTTSGEVEGSLLTGKIFSVSSNSGSVRVPPSTSNAGLCEIQTTSGDIRISVESAD